MREQAGRGAEDRATDDASRARHWRDVVLSAQHDLAEALASSLRAGHIDRQRYQNWLAMEAGLCRICALSLETIAGWHGAQPELRDASRAWASELGELVMAASCDIRALDGVANALPAALAVWHAFADGAAGSQRAGEVLGAVLLHSRLAGGPAGEVLGLLAASLGPTASVRFVVRRLQAGHAAGREALLEAYSASALTIGACRARLWHRSALDTVLRSPRPLVAGDERDRAAARRR